VGFEELSTATCHGQGPAANVPPERVPEVHVKASAGYAGQLDLLETLGAEFARENPVLAPELGERSSDPDVERVLEGVAFVAGQIRERLDLDYAEFVHTLVDAVWPHYLRPVPSMSIVEFEAAPGVAPGRPRRIPRGETRVASVPVDGTPCVFRTGHDVVLRPLAMESARFETRGRAGSLHLELCLLADVPPRELALDRLRLYLHADFPAAAQVFTWLVNGAREVELVASGADGTTRRVRVAAPDGLPVRPAGRGPDEALLPYPPHSFDGYRLLQEYFAIPQRFLFVDLVGLDALAGLGPCDRFEVVVHGSERPPAGVRVDAGSFRLHCAPVVNLFESAADPLRLDHRDARHLLRPQGLEATHYDIYSVDRVVGIPRRGGPRREYQAFSSFLHGTRGDAGRYYQLRRVRAGDRPASLAYLSVVTEPEGGDLPDEEWLSIEATCTNARLGEGLRQGDLSAPTDGSPDFAVFRNITPVSRSVLPPLGGELHGVAVRHMLLHYASNATVDSLRALLALYNFHAREDRQSARALELLLAAIVRVETEPESRRLRVSPVLGTHVRLVLDESGFLGEGGLYLFASVLEEFYALASSLNVYTRMTAIGANEREEFTWPARIGNRIIR